MLVTGASGFLGGNLARALIARGHRVRVLARGGRRPVALEGLDYELRVGDLCDAASLAAAVRGCRQVYHAAASLSFWCPTARDFEAVHRVNVEGTRALLDAAASAGVERVVHVSTVDAIGLPPRGEVADEETDWAGGWIDTPYARTKREAEAVARAARVETVIVNPAFMIGPWDPKPSSGRLLRPLARARMVAWPRTGGNNFVDVRDVVCGAIAAMAHGRPGERYILGHANLTYRELFGLALRVLGRRPLMVPVPGPVAQLVGFVLEGGARLAGRTPALTVALARLAVAGHYYSPAKAIRELGLPQTPVEVALRDAFRWYAAHS